MRLHIETLYCLDDQGRLTGVNDSSQGPAPRFLHGRTPEGNVVALRSDLPELNAEKLVRSASRVPVGLDTSAPKDELHTFSEILSRHRPIKKAWSGPNYRFPTTSGWTTTAVQVTPANASVLSPHLGDWLEDVADSIPMAAALLDDKAVSVCCSVRTTAQADEAGVETHPDFRGRGLALHAVVSWADAVLSAGRIPLYSTSWENRPSQRVAEQLGLIQYGSVLHIT